MMINLFFSLFVSILVGFLPVLILWRQDCRRQLPCMLTKLFISAGLGLGLSSCIFFLWLSILNLFSNSFVFCVVIELVIIILMGVIVFLRKTSHIDGPKETRNVVPKDGKISNILLLFFSVTLFLSLSSFVAASLKSPHGGWDAWMIWNLRARIFFRGAQYWQDAFLPLLPNPDYPMLLPMAIANLWKYTGKEIMAVPILVALIFTFSTVGLLCSSLMIMRTRAQGLIAGIALLAAPIFIKQGWQQYADIPVGFFMLATIVLICLYDRASLLGNYGIIALAGMCGACAAWTKNEGALFFIVVIISRLFTAFPLKKMALCVKELWIFLAGSLPVSLCAILFKLFIAGGNDFLTMQTKDELIHKLADFPRYFFIVNSFGEKLLHFGSLVIGIIPFLFIYLILQGVKSDKRDLNNIIMIILIILLMLIGYSFIFLITPFEVKWHLDTSFNRLLIQLWPSVIFVFFLLARPPEDILVE